MTDADADAAGVPEPPWWGSPRQPRARTPLSREAIVEAALRVLDREGLDGLSMRRVAEELDAGPASLYWHVASKDQLLTMVLDRVIGEIPLPAPDPARWQEQLAEVAHAGRAAFRRYRDVARASMGRVPIGPNLLRMVEWQLQLLHGAGLPPRAAAWFGDLLALYIAAHALEDEPQAAGGEADPGELMRRYMASLPPEQFPALTAAAPDLIAGDADERFEFGLQLLLRGLADRADDAT